MESAAVLAGELTRTDSTYLEQALDHYVTRRRDRVDEVQQKSRQIGTFALFDHCCVNGDPRPDREVLLAGSDGRVLSRLPVQ
nr:hypothetical protein [Halovenus salina]